jgi:alpha-L-fucosidase
MRRAAVEMARVRDINAKSRYRPDWESLDRHVLPEWYADAKFGMFIDWGLYSVPAYAPKGYPDWYLYGMLFSDEVRRYHDQVWGKDFARDDFIPLFTAADYDPELVARTAEAAGVRYVIPFLKHHDGFCLWPSTYTLRNASEMGPKRDLAGPLAAACRKRSLKFGFYFSLDEWEYPVIDAAGALQIRTWQVGTETIRMVPYVAQEWQGKISGKIPVADLYNQYINPQAVEFIDRYDPDILWFDGDWIAGADERNSRTVVAYFYNHAEGRKEVAINDRMGLCRSEPTLGQPEGAKPHGDFYTNENAYEPGKAAGFRHMWEEISGLSSSFGHNWRETDKEVRSAAQVLHMLIDVVSQGGNLLLITNLTGSGRLDPLLTERLKVVGAWLKENGEAIYGTRQWTQARLGKDVRFTRSKDSRYVYAICLKWPQAPLSLPVHAAEGGEISLLGGGALPWHRDPRGVVIDIPATPARPNQPAWVLRIPL